MRRSLEGVPPNSCMIIKRSQSGLRKLWASPSSIGRKAIWIGKANAGLTSSLTTNHAPFWRRRRKDNESLTLSTFPRIQSNPDLSFFNSATIRCLIDKLCVTFLLQTPRLFFFPSLPFSIIRFNSVRFACRFHLLKRTHFDSGCLIRYSINLSHHFPFLVFPFFFLPILWYACVLGVRICPCSCFLDLGFVGFYLPSVSFYVTTLIVLFNQSLMSISHEFPTVLLMCFANNLLFCLIWCCYLLFLLCYSLLLVCLLLIRVCLNFGDWFALYDEYLLFAFFLLSLGPLWALISSGFPFSFQFFVLIILSSVFSYILCETFSFSLLMTEILVPPLGFCLYPTPLIFGRLSLSIDRILRFKF